MCITHRLSRNCTARASHLHLGLTRRASVDLTPLRFTCFSLFMFHRISAREMIVMKTHIGLLNTTEEGGADVALLTPDFVNSFSFFYLTLQRFM